MTCCSLLSVIHINCKLFLVILELAQMCYYIGYSWLSLQPAILTFFTYDLGSTHTFSVFLQMLYMATNVEWWTIHVFILSISIESCKVLGDQHLATLIVLCMWVRVYICMREHQWVYFVTFTVSSMILMATYWYYLWLNMIAYTYMSKHDYWWANMIIDEQTWYWWANMIIWAKQMMLGVDKYALSFIFDSGIEHL